MEPWLAGTWRCSDEIACVSEILMEHSDVPAPSSEGGCSVLGRLVCSQMSDLVPELAHAKLLKTKQKAGWAAVQRKETLSP